MTTRALAHSDIRVGHGANGAAKVSADDVGLAAVHGVPRWKRRLDLSLALLALVVLSPIMIVAALLIRMSSPGPILFRQTRVGCGGRPFTMCKFRTMYTGGSDADHRGAILLELKGEATPDPESNLFRPESDPRITPVGRLLREYSIDELPQLFNVIKGDMSLVGPRPALPWEAELFSERHRRRDQVLPGITGLWQTRGRNLRSSLEMLELDLEYIEQCSLRLDLGILLATPRAVLFDRNTR